jgi:hypothetical protein
MAIPLKASGQVCWPCLAGSDSDAASLWGHQGQGHQPHPAYNYYDILLAGYKGQGHKPTARLKILGYFAGKTQKPQQLPVCKKWRVKVKTINYCQTKNIGVFCWQNTKVKVNNPCESEKKIYFAGRIQRLRSSTNASLKI